MHRSFPSTCPILSKHSYLSTHYNRHIGSDSVDRTNAALVFWNVSHERRTASICVAQTRQSYSVGNVHQSHSYKTTDVGGRRNGGNDSILFARPVGCQYEAQPSGDSLNPSVATADLLPGCLCAGGRRVCAPPLFRNNFWIGAEYQHETCMFSGHQFDIWLKNINPTDFSYGPDTVRPVRLTSVAGIACGRCDRPQAIPARGK